MTGHLTDRWYVGFTACPNRGVYRLARGRFGHCMAFRPDGSGRWLLVEHNVWGMDVQHWESERICRLMTLCILKGTLFLSPRKQRPHRTLPAPVVTCASIIAALTGLEGWYFTPYQLYRGLQRAGADVVSRAEVLP